jgi:hypothetical protein
MERASLISLYRHPAVDLFKCVQTARENISVAINLSTYSPTNINPFSSSHIDQFVSSTMSQDQEPDMIEEEDEEALISGPLLVSKLQVSRRNFSSSLSDQSDEENFHLVGSWYFCIRYEKATRCRIEHD